MRIAAGAAALLLLVPGAVAQESGWHYSPLPGEGDRATLGCARDATGSSFTCLAVRCEDDFTVGLHIHTSRAGGDAGRWRLTVDEEQLDLEAATDSSPYHARVGVGAEAAIDRIRNGAVAYLHPLDGAAIPAEAIPLTGSFGAIGTALYFCAPRVPPAASQQL
jgi:hypothetical protein